MSRPDQAEQGHAAARSKRNSGRRCRWSASAPLSGHRPAYARCCAGAQSTDAMYNAARDFQAAFVIAHLEPLRALSMLRVPGTGRGPSETSSNSMPGIAYKMRWTHLVGYPVRRALACGMWSEASAAFEIGRCASVGVADRCRKGMRRASWSRPSASWQPKPIHGAAGAPAGLMSFTARASGLTPTFGAPG